MAARTKWTEQNAAAFEALAQRLIDRAGDLEDRFPLGGLTAADRELLVDGFDWDELAGDDLIRRWAKAVGSRPDIRSIDNAHRSLSGFRKKGTANRRNRMAQEENALAVAEASMKRRNRPSARGLPDGIDPQAMIDSGSPSLMAMGFLLRERQGRLWYDDFHKSIWFDWGGSFDKAQVTPYEAKDPDLRRVSMWLRSLDSDLGSASKTVLEEAIFAVAEMDVRNEPADWMNALEWDGVPRVDVLLARIFKAPDTALNKAIGRNLMIGLAARILKPGIKLDNMVVLRGGQGINKSTACDVLGGSWYAQSHSSVDSKDFVQELRGLMILEVAELHSFLRSSSGAARIKAMLSVREDRYRRSYGRLNEKFPRTLVLIGTTNDQTFH
ncbi:MAG: VapE domain-containing protein, partial [Hyphomicrobium sp.]